MYETPVTDYKSASAWGCASWLSGCCFVLHALYVLYTIYNMRAVSTVLDEPYGLSGYGVRLEHPLWLLGSTAEV